MVPTPTDALRTIVARAYVPLIALGGGGAIIVVARQSKVAIVAIVVGAVAASFAAERIVPYDRAWNLPRRDRLRDIAHAIVNETSTALGVMAIPLLVNVAPTPNAWPSAVPFPLQVLGAALVLDAGITIVHWWSHRNGLLWQFHAVHHSVDRLYGFNGLMKHPLHQAVETGAGMLPLVLLGVTADVAAALAGLVALQLLLQHSNVDYRVGGARRWLALNQGHRLHHVARVPDGDVNFGLFLLIWDRLLGTYRDPTGRAVHDGDVGLAGQRDFPVQYAAQLLAPFQGAAKVNA